MIRKLISFKSAGRLGLLLFGLFFLFHLFIIIGMIVFDIVPLDYLWGGRMETKQQLLSFEIVSLLLMLTFFVVVAIKTGWINRPGLLKTSTILLWIMLGIFILNTIGNILATSLFEKFFAIVTALFALISYRLAIEK